MKQESEGIFMYHFDEIISRWNTSCTKWDGAAADNKSHDIIPMGIADMDFRCPNPVTEAVTKRAMHPVYGYTLPSDACYQAIINYFKSVHNYNIQKDWIVFTHGVVDGINSAVLGVTSPGERVLIQPPVYYPFFSVLRHNQCIIVDNPLTSSDGYYQMDFDAMEASLKTGVKAILLCSPHNPVGRVWKEQELKNLAELCQRYGSVLISDEIHCDLVYPPNRHVSALNIPNLVENSISLFSVSKTYNVPGLTTAFAVIPDKKLRSRFLDARMGQNGGNLFGYEALSAAYENGQEYRLQLLDYLQENITYFNREIKSYFPDIYVYPTEGTYLVWADFNKYNLPESELIEKLTNTCHLVLDQGSLFGPKGEGFFRFNLACPRMYITNALDRMRQVLKNTP